MKKTCCCCISSLFSLLLVIVLAVCGGSWYLFNSYVKPIVGISLVDTIGIYSAMHKADESKIVTNPFNATADLESFERKFNEALFISGDTQISFKDVINEAFGSGDPEVADQLTKAAESAGIANQAAFNSSSLVEVLKGINFDFSSLTNYNGDTSKGAVRVTDTEVAAMVNLVVEEMAAKFLANSLPDINITEFFSVKQVKVNAETVDRANDRISMTVALNLRDFAMKMLDKLPGGTGMNIAKNAAYFLKAIIPMKIFLTVDIAPYNSEVLPTFRLNEFSDKNHNNTISMINGMFNYFKHTEGIDHFSTLIQSLDAKVKSVFTTLDNYIALDFAGNAADLDTIQIMLKALKLEQVTKVDFLYMVSYINCVDLTELDGITYDKEATDNYINSFKSNYAVADSYTITGETFLKDIGGVAKNIDMDKINLDVANDNIDTLLSYDALVDIISSSIKDSQAKSAVSNMNDIINKIDIKSLWLTDLATEELAILVKLPLADVVRTMLGENPNELVAHLAGQLLPEVMYLQFNIQMIKDGKISMVVNGLSNEQTQSLFATIKNLMTSLLGADKAEQFSYDGMSDTVAGEVTKAIDGVENHPTTPIDLIFTDKGVDLPSIYELMQIVLKIEGEVDGSAITPDDIRLTIKGSNELAAVEQSIINDSTDQDIADKFKVINPRIEIDESTGERRYLAKGEPNIHISDKQFNQKVKAEGMTKDPAYTVEIKQTLFADLSSTAAIKSQLLESTTAGGFYSNKLSNHTSSIAIVTSEINIILPEDSDSNMSVIPDKLYATIIADIADMDGANTDFYINDMGKKNTRVIELMMSALAKKEVNFNKMLTDIMDKMNSTKLPIAYNEQNITIPGIGISIPNIQFDSEELDMEEIISKGRIANCSDLAKGYGEFYLDRTIQLDVTEIVEQIIKDNLPIFPPNFPIM